MKSVFVIDDNGQGMKGAQALLREHGYSVAEVETAPGHESEFYRFALDRACVQAFCVSHDQRIMYVNDSACRALGYTREELMRMSVPDIDPHYPGDRGQSFSECWDKLRETGSARFETYHRAKDGRVYPVEIHSNFFEFVGGEYTCAFATDISDRKRAEEKFRLLTESSPNGIILIQDERIVYANPAAIRMSGYAREDLSGMKFWKFIHDDFRDVARARALTRQQGRPLSDRQEYRLVGTAGKDSWVMATSVTMEYEGRPAVLVTFVDITETRRAQEALRESETRLKMAMEIAKLVQWEYDVSTATFRLDNVLYTLYGTSEDRETGISMPLEVFARKFVHPDDYSLVMKEIERSVAGVDGKKTGQMEHRIIDSEGEERTFFVRYRVISNRDGQITGLRGASQDVTEVKRAELKKKNLEVQLYQAQKMEAVGQFAGGIAHDFSNVLSAIMGFAEIMVMKMEDGNPFLHYVRQILASAERAADLTHGLLAFSRKQGLNIRPFDVRGIVDGVKKMLRRLIPEDIDLRIATDSTEMTVMADKGQIEQVLMNLVTNARDAMPQGGSLIIGVESFFMDETFYNEHGFGIPGMYARISVEDTGRGMDETTRERVFEPFFTTKAPGKGTGLGLSIIYGIVKQHKGFITVDSSPGQGTIINVYFPLVDPVKQVLSEMVKFEPVPGGVETILLAEDDDLVRQLNRTILEEAGYSVVEAVDGREALSSFKELQSNVDMLVTDVIMPNMDGKMLYEEVLKIRPDMKVLFMSGYSTDILDGRAVFDCDVNFMAKPAKPTEFLKKLRKIIDG